jgi:hypothetical protein
MVFALELPALYAEEAEEETEMYKKDYNGKIFFTFSQGLTAAWLTRIIKQSGRSNFVFRDFLPGLYFGSELRNIKYVVPMARLAVYYPLYSTFNDVLQPPKIPLHYAADMMIGARVEPLNLKYLRVNAGPALHMFFLNAERWNYFNIGVAAVLGIEVPLFSRWTLLVDGYASLDNGNLGANRRMEPFDMVWQYQINIGFRYTKKKNNTATMYSFFAETTPRVIGFFKRLGQKEASPDEAALFQEAASLEEAVSLEEVEALEEAGTGEAGTIDDNFLIDSFMR